MWRERGRNSWSDTCWALPRFPSKDGSKRQRWWRRNRFWTVAVVIMWRKCIYRGRKTPKVSIGWVTIASNSNVHGQQRLQTKKWLPEKICVHDLYLRLICDTDSTHWSAFLMTQITVIYSLFFVLPARGVKEGRLAACSLRHASVIRAKMHILECLRKLCWTLASLAPAHNC